MKRLRVILINVGHRTSTGMAHSPPLGLLYVASYLRKHRNVDIRVIDQRAENASCDTVLGRVISFAPDIVGFRCLSADAALLQECVAAVKSGLRSAFVVVGGPYVSATGSRVLEDAPADAAVVGEGELAFEQIAAVVADGDRDFSHISGLIWRDASNDIIVNPGTTPFVEDLDLLPMPAYDLVDVPIYGRMRNMSMVPWRKYLALFTSRGCPYHCNYCHHIFGKRYRAHSAERVADELEYFSRRFGYRDFDFLDDVFNLDRKRVLALSELVRQRGLDVKIAFPNGLRTDILDSATVDALADMGVYYSAFALETGTPRVQKLIGKNLDIPRFLEGVRLATKRGIFSFGFMMLGFPTETEEELQTTIRVACQSELHAGLFFVVTPYAGTELRELALRTCPERFEALKLDDSDYVYNFSVNVSAVPDDVLLASVRSAYRRFYVNPRRLLRVLRDHPAPFQLLEFRKALLRLTRKSSMRETDTPDVFRPIMRGANSRTGVSPKT